MCQALSWILGQTTQQNRQKSKPPWPHGTYILVGVKTCGGEWGVCWQQSCGSMLLEFTPPYLTIILKGKLTLDYTKSSRKYFPLTTLYLILCICHILFKQSLILGYLKLFSVFTTIISILAFTNVILARGYGPECLRDFKKRKWHFSIHDLSALSLYFVSSVFQA